MVGSFCHVTETQDPIVRERWIVFIDKTSSSDSRTTVEVDRADNPVVRTNPDQTGK